MPSFENRNLIATLLLIGSVAVVAAPASAQEIDSLFRDFYLAGEFMLELEGEKLQNGEVFMAERARSYLLMAPELASPLLVNTQAQNVQSVSLLKVQKNDDGTIDLLADAAFEVVGPFQIKGTELVFSFSGKTVTLKKKPPLVGMQTFGSMMSYNPTYASMASEYVPDDGEMTQLLGEKRDVRIRVYFGSWCSVCSRLVPRIMKVAEKLEGSKISFEYYGLPQPMHTDPETQDKRLTGVPTTIIYVAGDEVGRLTGKDLYSPEASLGRVLSGA
ncbi:MAG: thioredoxin family protein [Holophagales bacterium]|nr:thioredoxin family protein [Holophagales bacterium]